MCVGVVFGFPNFHTTPALALAHQYPYVTERRPELRGAKDQGRATGQRQHQGLAPSIGASEPSAHAFPSRNIPISPRCPLC